MHNVYGMYAPKVSDVETKGDSAPRQKQDGVLKARAFSKAKLDAIAAKMQKDRWLHNK